MNHLDNGESVIDKDSADTDIMRVLDPGVGRANEVEIENLGNTVHSMNPEYPSNDPVVRTVFENWLDSNVPEWDQWPLEELQERLDEYSRKWGISVKSYLYPKSRLIRVELKED